MPKRFKEASRRQQFVAIAGLIVLSIAAWAVKTRGLFEGVTFLIASAAFLVGLVQVLPARPKLRLTALGNDHPHLAVQPVGRPLDENAIVQEQISDALSEMPSQSTSHGVGFGAENALQALSGFTGAYSDEHLDKYREKVRRFEVRLRNWLTDLEVARADRLRLFDGELRLHELGHAPADHARLRLFFPEGFELEDEAPDIGDPPKTPNWTTGLSGLLHSNTSIARLRGRGLLDQLRRDDDEAQYGLKDGLPEVTYELGRVNQSDDRPVPCFRLKAPRQPGTYQVRWEATATGLSKPARGTLTIEVREPIDDAPISSLSEAEGEREEFEL